MERSGGERTGVEWNGTDWIGVDWKGEVKMIYNSVEKCRSIPLTGVFDARHFLKAILVTLVGV